MIDPGHGGNDSGAFAGGVKESNVVLDIALKLEKKLQESKDFDVQMTRREDQKMQLHERVRRAELSESEIFISLHANSSTDSRARGMELYFQNHVPPDEETLMLAALENQKELLDEAKSKPSKLSRKNDIAMIVEDLRRSNRVRSSRRLSLNLSKSWTAPTARSVRQAPFHVVSRISIPSVLMEIGFLTNSVDRSQLQSPAMQQQIVENIYEGLQSFRVDSGPLLDPAQKQ